MSQEDVRKDVLDLMKEKDAIENKIRDLTSILTRNGVGMNDPLVDSEGFPLNTIDVYQVRNARHQIICLQNDHKNVMKRIENGLQSYYGSTPGSNNSQANLMVVDQREVSAHKVPFAKVTLVSENSPAEYAGVHVGDEIVEFGSVNANNFKNITDIATVVQHSEGTRVDVRLKRAERFLTLHLIPKKWGGKGFLGCNIVSI